MGATLHRDFRVFKIFSGVNDDDLFGSGELVIVMSEQTEKNCFPHIYKWRFEFIGGLNSFQQIYLPKTAAFYDDGLSQSPLADNGNHFCSHIKSLYKQAGVLTIEQLHDLDWYGYSWPDKSFAKTINTNSHKKLTNYLGTRYAHQLMHQEDIERMVREAFDIVPSGSQSPWMAELWRLDALQVDIIGRAGESED